MSPITVETLPSRNPSPPSNPKEPPSHWVNNPPTAFTNPWPSFQTDTHGLFSAIGKRFGSNRNFVPIPTDKSELVQVRAPDWGRKSPGWESKLKATWMGHAGFIVEMPIPNSPTETTSTTQAEEEGGIVGTKRGVTIFMDAVFAERMSPVSFAGPKRFTPLPCTVAEIPEIDLVIMSHNHYDHMDLGTIRDVYARNKERGIHFFAGLNTKNWFCRTSGLGIQESEVTETDWWECVDVNVPGRGSLRLTCAPTQHFSGRSLRDHGHSLWCSFAVEELLPTKTGDQGTASQIVGKKLYFAGDTAYGSAETGHKCPAFKQIGQALGPFDLALLPIGCYSPVDWMSNVHASPEDSLEIHKEVKSKKSVGMHFGAIRGGISSQYEPVTEPPRRWREACEKEGKWASGECGLCDVGETVAV